jgi:preprotein translocase subunit YajC
MSPSSLVATIFAQATNAAPGTDGSTAAAGQGGAWTSFMYIPLFVAMIYFALIRPQQQAKKKAEETTSGIHGVITNVKDTTVILKIADNVKIEVEKSHIDKITRPDTTSSSDKPAAVKA